MVAAITRGGLFSQGRALVGGKAPAKTEITKTVALGVSFGLSFSRCVTPIAGLTTP